MYNAAVAALSETPRRFDLNQELSYHFPGNLPDRVSAQFVEIGREIFAAENITETIPEPPAICNSLEGARYRDLLLHVKRARGDDQFAKEAAHTISEALGEVAFYSPRDADSDVTSTILGYVERLPQVVHNVAATFFANDESDRFQALKKILDRNLEDTGRTPVLARDYKKDDVIEVYLKGTPLTRLFDIRVPFSISEETRFEHTHMVAGTGHGKSQTIQHHIVKDLEDVIAGDKSVVVIDSQGDLIRNILKTALPKDRVVLIDPEDIEYPVSLNLFAVGQHRYRTYNRLERERLTNSILELYDFVLGSLLEAGMTQKQGVIFRYVTRLMLLIPDATIHTLREVLEREGSKRFAAQIDQLEGTAREFFRTEFDGKEFQQTRQQVLRRLYGILENQAFERMFSNPVSKLDLFTEMNAGKLILINTAKSLLKENGTQIFGRFFIALIAQAAQERATLQKRKPTFVYIDEAQDYFDQNLDLILSQARKFNIGLFMAHQYLGQLDGGLQASFEANTSIKYAGGVSARDARGLAAQMNTDPEALQHQPKGTFAAFVRGQTKKAVPVTFPFFTLEQREKASDADVAELRSYTRERYAAPIAELRRGQPETPGGDPDQGAAAKDQGARRNPAGKKPGQADDRDAPDTAASPEW